MSPSTLRHALFRSLIVISVFHAVSAIGGGVAMVATDGMGMPRYFLAASPFSSFVIPGLILLLVVGGTQAVASIQLLTRGDTALLSAAVAGFGMVIWIVCEIGIISEFSWPQMIYLATGLTQLVLVYGLLGIVSWLPRLAPGPPRGHRNLRGVRP